MRKQIFTQFAKLLLGILFLIAVEKKAVSVFSQNKTKALTLGPEIYKLKTTESDSIERLVELKIDTLHYDTERESKRAHR